MIRRLASWRAAERARRHGPEIVRGVEIRSVGDPARTGAPGGAALRGAVGGVPRPVRPARRRPLQHHPGRPVQPRQDLAHECHAGHGQPAHRRRAADLGDHRGDLRQRAQGGAALSGHQPVHGHPAEGTGRPHHRARQSRQLSRRRRGGSAVARRIPAPRLHLHRHSRHRLGDRRQHPHHPAFPARGRRHHSRHQPRRPALRGRSRRAGMGGGGGAAAVRGAEQAGHGGPTGARAGAGLCARGGGQARCRSATAAVLALGEDRDWRPGWRATRRRWRRAACRRWRRRSSSSSSTTSAAPSCWGCATVSPPCPARSPWPPA